MAKERNKRKTTTPLDFLLESLKGKVFRYHPDREGCTANLFTGRTHESSQGESLETYNLTNREIEYLNLKRSPISPMAIKDLTKDEVEALFRYTRAHNLKAKDGALIGYKRVAKPIGSYGPGYTPCHH